MKFELAGSLVYVPVEFLASSERGGVRIKDERWLEWLKTGSDLSVLGREERTRPGARVTCPLNQGSRAKTDWDILYCYLLELKSRTCLIQHDGYEEEIRRNKALRYRVKLPRRKVYTCVPDDQQRSAANALHGELDAVRS